MENITSHPVWVRGLKHSDKSSRIKGSGVAPRVGAWIETVQSADLSHMYMSHPVWVRGLKPPFDVGDKSRYKSHPVWVRGLKPEIMNRGHALVSSHPVWVRGLKLC